MVISYHLALVSLFLPSTCSMHGHAGGLWGDEWSLKGLTLGAHVDIIVVAPKQLQFYPKGSQYSLPTARSAPVKQVVAPYIIFSSKYRRRHYDLPAEAFADTTRFMMHDGLRYDTTMLLTTSLSWMTVQPHQCPLRQELVSVCCCLTALLLLQSAIEPTKASQAP